MPLQIGYSMMGSSSGRPFAMKDRPGIWSINTSIGGAIAPDGCWPGPSFRYSRKDMIWSPFRGRRGAICAMESIPLLTSLAVWGY